MFMTTQNLLNRIAQLPQCNSDVPTVPPMELVALVVRWNRGPRKWNAGPPAAFASVSLSTIERIERGEKVSDEAVDRIAQAFGYAAGYFTTPRLPLSAEETATSVVETYSNLEIVPVGPMKTHRAVRDAARCDGILIHRPEVPETYDSEIANLREWLDLSSFILSDILEHPSSEYGRRDLYNDVLACVGSLEQRGLTVLSGVMSAPQDRLPDWKVAVISITPRLTDPGAAKRRHLIVDRRVVALPSGPATR